MFYAVIKIYIIRMLLELHLAELLHVELVLSILCIRFNDALFWVL